MQLRIKGISAGNKKSKLTQDQKLEGMTAFWSVSMGKGFANNFLASKADILAPETDLTTVEMDLWKAVLEYGFSFYGDNRVFLADLIQAWDFSRFVVKESKGGFQDPINIPNILTDDALYELILKFDDPDLFVKLSNEELVAGTLAEIFYKLFKSLAEEHGNRYKAALSKVWEDKIKSEAIWQWKDAIRELQGIYNGKPFNHGTVLDEVTQNPTLISKLWKVVSNLTDKNLSIIAALERLQKVALEIPLETIKTARQQYFIKLLQTLEPGKIGPMVRLYCSYSFVREEVALMICAQRKCLNHAFLYAGKPVKGLEPILKEKGVNWDQLHFFNPGWEPLPVVPSQSSTAIALRSLVDRPLVRVRKPVPRVPLREENAFCFPLDKGTLVARAESVPPLQLSLPCHPDRRATSVIPRIPMDSFLFRRPMLLSPPSTIGQTSSKRANEVKTSLSPLWSAATQQPATTLPAHLARQVATTPPQLVSRQLCHGTQNLSRRQSLDAQWRHAQNISFWLEQQWRQWYRQQWHQWYQQQWDQWRQQQWQQSFSMR